MLKQDESLYTIKEICEDLSDSGYKDFNTHNLGELGNVLTEVFDLKSDEYLNRVYTKSDLNKLRKALGLKEKVVNYEPIRNMLIKAQVSENSHSKRTDKYAEELQIVKEKSIVTGPSIEDFKEFMVDIVSSSLRSTIVPELSELKKDLIDLKLQNMDLKTSLEKQQEEHFRQIDNKLAKWREESFNRRKPWYKKIFK